MGAKQHKEKMLMPLSLFFLPCSVKKGYAARIYLYLAYIQYCAPCIIKEILIYVLYIKKFSSPFRLRSSTPGNVLGGETFSHVYSGTASHSVKLLPKYQINYRDDIYTKRHGIVYTHAGPGKDVDQKN